MRERIFQGAPSPGPDFLKIKWELCPKPAEAGRWGRLIGEPQEQTNLLPPLSSSLAENSTFY